MMPIWPFQSPTIGGSNLPAIFRERGIDAAPRVDFSPRKKRTAAAAPVPESFESPLQHARDSKLQNDMNSPGEYAPLAALGDSARLSREKIAATRVTVQSVELQRARSGLEDSGLLGALQELEFIVLKEMRAQHEVVWSKGIAHGQWLARVDEQKQAAQAAELAQLKSELFRKSLELETTSNNMRLALNRNEELEDELQKLRAAPAPVGPFYYQGPVDLPAPTEPTLELDQLDIGDLTKLDSGDLDAAVKELGKDWDALLEFDEEAGQWTLTLPPSCDGNSCPF